MSPMTHTVAFDQPLNAPDGYGGAVQGWGEVFRARASLRFLRGGETVQAARLQGRQPVVVTIRASGAAAQITPGWRMRDRAETVFNIRSVVRTDDRMFYELTAESGVEA